VVSAEIPHYLVPKDAARARFHYPDNDHGTIAESVLLLAEDLAVVEASLQAIPDGVNAGAQLIVVRANQQPTIIAVSPVVLKATSRWRQAPAEPRSPASPSRRSPDGRHPCRCASQQGRRRGPGDFADVP
jgi:hypothetical protein